MFIHRLSAINHHISCKMQHLGSFTAMLIGALICLSSGGMLNGIQRDCIVVVTANTRLRVCILNPFPCNVLKAVVIKGLESLGIASSCYLWVQHRKNFYSALLSKKRLCRWARLQCWLTGKSGKNALSVLHMSCSKHERKRERYLSGDATGEIKQPNISQQKLPWISMYQCEEQILLFFFSCHSDVPVTSYSLLRILQHHEFLLLLSWYPSFIAICHHSWKN